jgi:hypothetical protein
LKVD